MLLRTGRGLSPLAKPVRATTFDFTSALHADFTYTRNDTVATYRDGSGNLQKGTANTPRFDHDINGNNLGMILEGSIQNKITAYNANPTDTTNWTLGGDAAATLVAVNDPSSYLSAAKFSSVCTGGKLVKLDNSGGSTDAYAESAATFGSTSVHTISAYIVATGGGTAAQLTRSGTSPTSLDIASGSSLERYALTLTPNASGDKMRILAKPGKIVYFILSQIEALDFASSVIVTAGSAATRAQDRVTVTSITSKSWYKAAQGAIIGRFRFLGTRPANFQFPFLLNDNSAGNTIGMRLYTDGSFRGYVNASGSGKNIASMYERPMLCVSSYPVAVAWKSGQSITSAGPMRYSDATYSGDPSGIDRLDVGAKGGGSDPMFGHIQSLKIYKSFRTFDQLGTDMVGTGDRVIIAGGQSNALGYFRSVATTSDTGKLKLIDTMNTVWTSSAHNYWTEAAQGSTAALNASTVNDWWYDDDTGDFGVPYQRWEKVALGCNHKIEAILWSQGEEDETALKNSVVTQARYKAALLVIFNKMRSVVGNVPVIIDPIGRRPAGSGDGLQKVRDAQKELDTDYSWIHLSPEKFDLALFDDIHLSDASYITQAQRIARKVLSALGETITGGVNGPTITGASRSGTTVTVTIAHDGGTDFTPTSAIEGFVYMDDTAAVTINTAVRTNATIITLTLNSTPTSGNQMLYYGKDSMGTVNNAKLVVDNATISLPLRSIKIAVT